MIFHIKTTWFVIINNQINIFNMVPFMSNTTLNSISNTSTNYLTHFHINRRNSIRNYFNSGIVYDCKNYISVYRKITCLVSWGLLIVIVTQFIIMALMSLQPDVWCSRCDSTNFLLKNNPWTEICCLS